MTVFSQLVHRHLFERGWTVQDLARSHAPKNPLVALRKINELLSDEHFRQGLADAICARLNIAPAEREAALVEDQRTWRKEVEDHQRAYFKPHIWIRVRHGWNPPLVIIAIAGKDIFREVPATSELLAAETDEEIVKLTSGIVVEHYNSKDLKVPREEVDFYLYRKTFDVAYRFTPEGSFVGIVTRRDSRAYGSSADSLNSTEQDS
jgi:hypothetical protein